MKGVGQALGDGLTGNGVLTIIQWAVLFGLFVLVVYAFMVGFWRWVERRGWFD